MTLPPTEPHWLGLELEEILKYLVKIAENQVYNTTLYCIGSTPTVIMEYKVQALFSRQTNLVLQESLVEFFPLQKELGIQLGSKIDPNSHTSLLLLHVVRHS